jgi:exopolysaccharide production protein ExoQ
MKIAKASLVKPGENLLYGVFALTVSYFVFAYSGRFGQVSILLYYAVWLPLVLVDYRRALGNYVKYVWIFAFAIFALLSVFWSAAPGTTARAGVQYLTHVICALIAMRALDVKTLTLGSVTGAGVVLAYSMLFGVYHFDPLDGTVSFVGAFDSKNQLGFYASLAVFFCFSAVILLKQRRVWLPVCGVVGLLAAYCLYASQSATSVLTTAAVLGLTVGMQVFSLLPPKSRKLLFIAATIFGTITVIAAVYGGAIDSVLGAFGKDSTLTGRTYLWQQGIEAARASPVIGIGYQAYWVRGFSEAERLWEEFFIGSRGGFHFHNTYIETMVELGAVGLLLLTGLFLSGLFGHLKRVLTQQHGFESLVLFGISALLFVRSFAEIDVIFPYQIGSFLLYITAGKLTLPAPQSASTPTPMFSGDAVQPVAHPLAAGSVYPYR